MTTDDTNDDDLIIDEYHSDEEYRENIASSER